MKVARYYNNSDVRIEEMPVPSVSAGELLIKVRASGICGSDVMEWYRIKKAPLVLGHEITGDIVEVGEGVDKFRVGDRIVATHHVPCNRCRYCLAGHHSVCDTLRGTNFYPGGFSEYLLLPPINVDRGTFLLPDNVSYDAGTFVEPLACVLRGLRNAGFTPGQSVFVVGSGISGLLHIKVAAAFGAGNIAAADLVETRLNAASRSGAGLLLDARRKDIPESMREFNDGLLADLVIICAGSPSAVETGLKVVERGGTLLFFAPTSPDVRISLPLWEIWRDGIQMATSYAGPPYYLLQAIELLAAGRIDVDDMVTHHLGLSDAQEGFELVSSGMESIKVIIHPDK